MEASFTLHKTRENIFHALRLSTQPPMSPPRSSSLTLLLAISTPLLLLTAPPELLRFLQSFHCFPNFIFRALLQLYSLVNKLILLLPINLEIHKQCIKSVQGALLCCYFFPLSLVAYRSILFTSFGF